MKKFLLIGFVMANVMLMAQTPEAPVQAPSSPMKEYYKPNISAATPKNQITPLKWDILFGIVDSQKVDLDKFYASMASKADTVKAAENVFYVLRKDVLSGKFGTIEYNIQLSRARTGNPTLPYPSVYAARDAAFSFAASNRTKRAVIKVLSGHRETICHDTKAITGADRIFTNNAAGVYGIAARAAIPPAKPVWDMALSDAEVEMDFRGTPEINPNASSLFVDGLDFLCESGSILIFSGVDIWHNYATSPNIIAFDSLSATDCKISFASNTHTDYSVNRFGIGGGYAHSVETQYLDCRVGRLTYHRSPFDTWGWTGFMEIKQTIGASIAPTDGNIEIRIGGTCTPFPIACYGVNAYRVLNSSMKIDWNGANTYLYFIVTMGNWNPARKGWLLRNVDLRVSGTLKSVRPDFTNNLHYNSYSVVSSMKHPFSSNVAVKVDADFDVQTGFNVQADNFHFRGTSKLNAHQYNGATVTPSFTVVGNLQFGGRLETDAINVAGGTTKPLPTGSTNLINSYGLPVW
jgi:hypothetical protein